LAVVVAGGAPGGRASSAASTLRGADAVEPEVSRPTDLSSHDYHSATTSAAAPDTAIPQVLPGTTAISAAVASCPARTEEHRESCRGACGPGCGRNAVLMPACSESDDVKEFDVSGGRFRCTYGRLRCETHASCQSHDACLEACRASYSCSTDREGFRGAKYKACQAACHASAINPICNNAWIKGKTTIDDGICATGYLDYSWLRSCERL